ncbi:hypothetical protein Salat_2432000 [Sesamum alatum]|uniref:Uncharacterized protein n=1 Tax=Sesamum alatum TaxID=300844 RepID=A0AAE1XY14_9LAMI|nr:hypothetical protein Salat_2432000 [Sesamum alatum]
MKRRPASTPFSFLLDHWSKVNQTLFRYNELATKPTSEETTINTKNVSHKKLKYLVKEKRKPLQYLRYSKLGKLAGDYISVTVQCHPPYPKSRTESLGDSGEDNFNRTRNVSITSTQHKKTRKTLQNL